MDSTTIKAPRSVQAPGGRPAAQTPETLPGPGTAEHGPTAQGAAIHLPNFSATAFLIADPARAAMLTALIDGRALPAGELAFAAGVSAPTASAHLRKMLDGGLLAVIVQGRHRYYRLAGAHIARALEQLAAIWPSGPVRATALSPQARELRFCRHCYDHLAGQVGVAVTHRLVERGHLIPTDERRYTLSAEGARWFAALDIDPDALAPSRAGLARACLDCTERRDHLGGPLGVAFSRFMHNEGWLRQARASRARRVTDRGWERLRTLLELDEDQIRRG